MRHCRNLLLVLICALTASCGPVRRQPERIPPSYEDAPVLFESFHLEYPDTANLWLMPQGLISLPPLGIEQIDAFDWVNHERNDQSWWIRMERMDYLLPLIESDDEVHEELVHDWIVGWLDAHETKMKPNKGSSDAMGIGIRGCILVRYLAEISREDPELAARIEKKILWTQKYLLEKRHFNLVSNHAMWEAMGLFETTRVCPDTSVTRIALDRLLSATELSVSKMGTHKEHSPSYHFHFLHWLDGFVTYLNSLDIPWRPNLVKMSQINDQMKAVTYFLYDQRLNVPQIGDTDARRYREPPYPVQESDRSVVLYDKEAGYAIYKDREDSDAKRYIFFCIQNQPPKMKYHIHNDRMAVFYSYDGEVIFGDQGRYSYSGSAMRTYMKSASAHNTILPAASLRHKNTSLELVDAPSWVDNEESTMFGAQSKAGEIHRDLVIPAAKPSFHVYDRLRRGGAYVLLWNIGPDVESLQGGRGADSDSSRTYRWVLTTKKRREFELLITVSGGNSEKQVEMEVIEGQKDPLLGWYSASYNSAVPIPVIMLRLTPMDEILVATSVTLKEP